MVNYANGKIYKIEPKCEHDDGDIYIGSTTKPRLCDRMATHRAMYKRWKDKKVDKHIRSYDLFDKYGVNNCEIVLLEVINCETKEELHAREKHFIKSNKCVNLVVPLRTEKEYYSDNKDKKREQKRKRYRENADVRDKVRDKGKLYRNSNKVAIAERKKQYREGNIDKIKENALQNAICECGCEVRKAKLSRHKLSIKHRELMKQKEKNN